MPAMQVATAMRKVVVPSVEWMGTMEALQEAVAEDARRSMQGARQATGIPVGAMLIFCAYAVHPAQ